MVSLWKQVKLTEVYKSQPKKEKESTAKRAIKIRFFIFFSFYLKRGRLAPFNDEIILPLPARRAKLLIHIDP